MLLQDSTPEKYAREDKPIIPTVHRLCPLCGHDNAHASPSPYSRDTWTIKQCVDCAMVYLETVPTYDLLDSEMEWQQSYAAEAQRRRQGKPIRSFISRSVKRLKPLIRGKERRIKEKRLIQRFIKSGRLLDVGCGEGDGLERLGEGFTPYGVEISSGAAAKADALCRLRGGYVVHDVATEGVRRFGLEYFDGMLMRAFLEHETQPLLLLHHARDALKPGGRLIIKVPNYASWNRIFAGNRWCGFRYPDHVNYFTPTTMRMILHKAGLKIIRFDIAFRFPFNDNMYVIAAREG